MNLHDDQQVTELVAWVRQEAGPEVAAECAKLVAEYVGRGVGSIDQPLRLLMESRQRAFGDQLREAEATAKAPFSSNLMRRTVRKKKA